MGYPESEWERVMQVHEVMMRALSGELHWFRAADILGVSARTIRRWREEYERKGCHGFFDRRRAVPSRRRAPAAIHLADPARSSGERSLAQPAPSLVAGAEDPEVVRQDLSKPATELDSAGRTHDGQPNPKSPELVQQLSGLARTEVEEPGREVLWVEQDAVDSRGETGFQDEGRVLRSPHERILPVFPQVP